MIRLLNQPRDIIEATSSVIIFIALYLLFLKIVYAQSPEGLFQRGTGYFVGRMITMVILYLLWFYSSRIIVNYIYYIREQR